MGYRIALLTGPLFSRASGIKVVVEGLSRELAQLGHEVCVFGQAAPAHALSPPADWTGATTRGFPFSGPRTFGFTKGMYPALAAFNPDIVHVHGIWTYPSVAGMRLKRATGATLIQSPHGMLSPAALAQSRLKKHLAMVVFQRKCLTMADGFHVTASAESDELSAVIQTSNVAVIRNGVDMLGFPPPAMKARKNRVLALCRLEQKKGLETLLAAWAGVQDARPDWTLEIRGPDRRAYRARLQGLATAQQLRNVVIGDGAYGVERDALMANSKLFVLPSKNENFGMTVAEALSLKTPVIASTGTPWSGLRDRECGWWTDSQEAALRSTLLSATATPDTRLDAMGEKGRDWMQNDFRWRDVAQDLSNFYHAMRREERATFRPQAKASGVSQG